MAVTLNREKILHQWTAIVEGGGGRDKWVIDKTEAAIKEVNAPGVTTKRETVTTGMLTGVQREFLVVTHQRLKEYAMFISARNFGKHLDVAWYLTVNPGFFKRTLSKKLNEGDQNAISMSLDLFAQQDLSAYTTVASKCLEKVIDDLVENELKQEAKTLTKRSKGFLSQW